MLLRLPSGRKFSKLLSMCGMHSSTSPISNSSLRVEMALHFYASGNKHQNSWKSAYKVNKIGCSLAKATNIYLNYVERDCKII